MKILVTGGAGFIGSHLVEGLLKKGDIVTIIDNLDSGSEKNIPEKAYTYYYSVTQQECEKVFEDEDIDVVIHLAAQVDALYSITHVTADAMTNIIGLVNILELSKKHNVKRFIFASSAAVYGDNKSIPLIEESKLNPINPYGMDKMIGENYCNYFYENYGLSTIVLRFANVYGPRQSYIGEGGVISVFLSKMKNHERLTVFGDGTQTRDFIFVEDVVEAIISTINLKKNGIYNIGTGKETSLNEIIGFLKEITDFKIVNEEFKKGDIKHSTLNCEKAKFELGFKSKVNINEGLVKTWEWYSDN